MRPIAVAVMAAIVATPADTGIMPPGVSSWDGKISRSPGMVSGASLGVQ